MTTKQQKQLAECKPPSSNCTLPTLGRQIPTERIRRLLKAYPKATAITDTYNEALQYEILKSGKTLGDIALNRNTPTLYDVDAMYDRRGGKPARVAYTWVYLRINFLNMACDQSAGMTDIQIQDLAEMIVSHYGFLNLAELSLFFVKFRLGYYGELYGALSPYRITCALRRFMSERVDSIAEAERMQQEAKEAALMAFYDKNHDRFISYEKYLQEKMKENGK